MSDIKNKQILIGISGGIAAYKMAELVRILIKKGAQVRVCMTRSATEFITPLTFQALTGKPVHTDLLSTEAEAAMGHIELARWADLILIAPATANFIAKLAHGHADDLLSTLCLASEAPIHIAPAMNRVMWTNTATQTNYQILKQRGFKCHDPEKGEQACGETGAGRLIEPQTLADLISLEFQQHKKPLAGKKLLITAGPTREAIDPVRFISNRSSGKMGYAIAKAAVEAGAEVILVSGPVALEAPLGVTRYFVESAREMHKITMKLAQDADIFIATAAVSDYSPANISTQKIKKSSEKLVLELHYNPDILFDVSHKYPDLFTVGFAAETEHLLKHAQKKLERKKLDMIVANPVGKNKGFDKDTNQLEIIWKDNHISLAENKKTQLASDLINIIVSKIT